MNNLASNIKWEKELIAQGKARKEKKLTMEKFLDKKDEKSGLSIREILRESADLLKQYQDYSTQMGKEYGRGFNPSAMYGDIVPLIENLTKEK